MIRKRTAFQQRLEQNSKNYFPKDLFDMEAAKTFLAALQERFGLETMLTDRHGAILQVHGEFGDFRPDVVNRPGSKLRVKGRTVGHIYIRDEKVPEAEKEVVKALLSAYSRTLEGFSEKSYLASEQAVYIDELEQELEKEAYQAKYDEQKDPLTGVLNRTYFGRRMKELTQREVVPTGVLCVNINDWKYANEHYGEEESDRLITIVADIVKQYAPQQAVIGRVDGDIFHVMLPFTEEDETRAYAQAVQEACQAYEDELLAPSVAVGCVMKTNVEETFKDLFSDAEYVMFENKLEQKNAPGYRQRLEKGTILK